MCSWEVEHTGTYYHCCFITLDFDPDYLAEIVGFLHYKAALPTPTPFLWGDLFYVESFLSLKESR